MKRIILAAMVSLALFGTGWFGPAWAQDSLGNRLMAAERYADTFDFKKIIEASIIEAAKNYPKEQRGTFIRSMSQGVDPQRLRSFAVNAMTQVFTLEELNALADFYGSPVGRSMLRKFPKYMGMIAPFINQELSRAAKARR